MAPKWSGVVLEGGEVKMTATEKEGEKKVNRIIKKGEERWEKRAVKLKNSEAERETL